MSLQDVIGTVVLTFQSLLYPFVFFILLGLIVKGKSLVTDARRALKESSLNLQLILFNTIFVAPLLTIASIELSDLVQTSSFYLFSADQWAVLPPVIVVFIAVFVGDFVGYWRHRLEHTKVFWPSHAVHHSDTEMTWLSLERFHPINRVTTFLIDNSVLLLMGLPPYAVVANVIVRHYYGFFIHADLPWTYGPLGKLFVSPAMHRWHHSLDHQAFNTNFATVFSVFDRTFGTYRVPGVCDVPLGVTDKMEQDFIGQISYALSPRAYKNLLGSSKEKQGDTDQPPLSDYQN